MTAISETTGAAALGLSAATGTRGTMGKEDFLKLLVAQLQHQDPLNPQDPTQFTAQLAQFSSLEQLFLMNKGLDRLAESEQLSSLPLIGREIVAEGGNFRFDSKDITLGYRLSEPAEEVRIHVQDAYGRTVATLSGEGLSAGEHYLAWNGKLDSGEMAEPGEYFLQVSAIQGEEEAFAADPLVKGMVSGVDFDSLGSLLVTSAGEYRMSQVRSVRSL